MTTDDILRMAREAGLAEGLSDTLRGEVLVWDAETKHLERFAALVAAAEREKVARWMRERGYATGHGDTVEALLGELRTQEREACDRIANAYEPRCGYPCAVAHAIRARGNK